MINIAFLASSVTLPDSPNRRADYHEHDLQVETLSVPMRAAGMTLIPVDWADEDEDWSRFDAAIIGTTWDYWDRVDAFLDRLAHIEDVGTPLFNSSALVKWNGRKTYLRELEARGARTIPTLWLEKPDAVTISKAFGELGSDDIVLKRQVGAGAQDQFRLRRGDPLTDYPYDAMIQPFMSTIQSDGEYSFIMIDGELSHVVRKRPQPHDYRIQSLYGGIETRHNPTTEEADAAKAIISLLDEPPLYARVDMIRGEDGGMLLMELEMIEPYLYPEQADELGELVTKALQRRLR